MTQKKWYWAATIFLMVLGFAARLFDHPANFAPIGAIALFGGLYLPGRLAILAPFGSLFVSDLFIGFYDWKMMILVYGCFVGTGIVGLMIRKKKTLARTVGGVLLCAVAFFLITNAGVWAFGTLYTKNLSGLFQSYLMAIPFFRNSLLGDLFYTGILVGSMELILLQLRVHTAKKQDSSNIIL